MMRRSRYSYRRGEHSRQQVGKSRDLFCIEGIGAFVTLNVSP